MVGDFDVDQGHLAFSRSVHGDKHTSLRCFFYRCFTPGDRVYEKTLNPKPYDSSDCGTDYVPCYSRGPSFAQVWVRVTPGGVSSSG
jgi:hypothetical protein